ncbi:MAG: exosortase/archaeosortase family protein [Pirellulales bacterium]|nr:exosortase/archaeosortase family protein [Pirellulales bacterium]
MAKFSKLGRDETPPAETTVDRGEGRSTALPLGLAMAAAIVWAYWPTIRSMAAEWESQPDYSHGYLVLPIALIFLWLRRDEFPRHIDAPNLWGLAVLLVVAAIRAGAGVFYLQPLDGWTLPLTIAGAVLLAGGRQVLRWSLPSIAFLWFMVPIPYSAERWLSVPLQGLASTLSTRTLVCLGQPAVAEGNTILLNDHRLFVEEACSGLRIFVGIFALAFAFVLFSRWKWWQKAMVLAAALPVAIIANVSRIVVTALLQEFASSDAAHKFSHDLAGFVMIPFAALLFWLFLIYLSRLFPEVEEISAPNLAATLVR